MRIFVTGATGFIGSAVTRELLDAGHDVLGLARSDDKAKALAATGAEIYRGTLDDPAALKKAAAGANGVVHLAFNHDFSKFVENCENDRHIIETLGLALAGSNRPLLVTSGLNAKTEPGVLATEDDDPVDSSVVPRSASEEAAAAAAANGTNVSVVRLPQVHDPVKQGLVSAAIDIYRQKEACSYVGDGDNHWPAAHVDDVARLYRLALEKAEPNARYHAVAEEGVTIRDIADTVGKHLHFPVPSITAGEAVAFFGWLAPLVGEDMLASSNKTRSKLGWHPTGPTLLADLDKGRF